MFVRVISFDVHHKVTTEGRFNENDASILSQLPVLVAAVVSDMSLDRRARFRMIALYVQDQIVHLRVDRIPTISGIRKIPQLVVCIGHIFHGEHLDRCTGVVITPLDIKYVATKLALDEVVSVLGGDNTHCAVER